MKIIQTPYFNQQNSWLEANCQLISWHPHHPFITCHRSPKIMSILHASNIGGRRCKFSFMVNVKKYVVTGICANQFVWFKNNITHISAKQNRRKQANMFRNILKREGNSSSHCEREMNERHQAWWWHDDMCRVKEARSNLVPVSLSSPGPGSGRLALASSHQSPSLPGAPRRQSDPDSGASTISDSVIGSGVLETVQANLRLINCQFLLTSGHFIV